MLTSPTAMLPDQKARSTKGSRPGLDAGLSLRSASGVAAPLLQARLESTSQIWLRAAWRRCFAHPPGAALGLDQVFDALAVALVISGGLHVDREHLDKLTRHRQLALVELRTFSGLLIATLARCLHPDLVLLLPAVSAAALGAAIRGFHRRKI